MQDSDKYCFQLIEEGVAFPPILIKAEILSAAPHGAPSSSSQNSSNASLRLQAIRFLNGKQELVQYDLGGEDSDAFVKAVSGKKGLNRHMSCQDCCQEVYDRFKDRKFLADYEKRDSVLKIIFDGIKALDIVFDFKIEVKRFPVTPAFVVAFETACSFGKLAQSAVKSSSRAAEELKQKERELRQAERRANNLTADLSVEKQRFQRLLASGGSSLEDALAPRGARRNASSFMEGSILAPDPDSPRKKRKAADAVLVKAGRTAQKETKKGFIDSDSEEEDDDDEADKPSTSKSKGKGKSTKPSSTETAASSSSGVGTSRTAKVEKKSPKSAGKQKAKVVEVPSLNARRSIRSAKDAPNDGFVESEEEEEELDTVKEDSGSGGKPLSEQEAHKKVGTSNSDTEKTASDSDTETVKKGKKGKK